ncbi:MAG: AAA family ATPase [Candidatus Tectomicrobia bacterium]|nr:AAA family ATPase [Candidatus Tectomicrobia bacterium]
MIITALDIDGFGCLLKRSFTFGPGLNLVHGPNESGKSTLQACIGALLYGLKRVDTKVTKYEDAYERFLPWNAEVRYGARLQYELAQGSRFEVFRVFTQEREECLLTDLQSGRNVTSSFKVAKNRERLFAQDHLGVSKTVFLSTAFITQTSLRRIGEENAGTHLLDKLQRIAGDSTASSELRRAQQRLQKALDDIGTERTWVRGLGAAQDRQAALEKELDELRRRRDALAVDQQRRDGLRGSLTTLQRQARENRGEQERRRAALALKRCRQALEHQRQRDNLTEEINGLRSVEGFPAHRRDLIRERRQHLAHLAEEQRRAEEQLTAARETVEASARELGAYPGFEQLPEDASQRLANLQGQWESQADNVEKLPRAIPANGEVREALLHRAARCEWQRKTARRRQVRWRMRGATAGLLMLICLALPVVMAAKFELWMVLASLFALITGLALLTARGAGVEASRNGAALQQLQEWLAIVERLDACLGQFTTLTAPLGREVTYRTFAVEATTLIERLKEYEARRRAQRDAEKEAQRLRGEVERLDEEMQKVQGVLTAFLQEAGVTTVAEFEEGAERAGRREHLQRQLTTEENLLAESLGNEDLETLRARATAVPVELLDGILANSPQLSQADIEAGEAACRNVDGEVAGVQAELQGIEGEIRRALEGCRDLAVVEEELQEAAAEVARLTFNRQALEVAKGAMQAAADEFHGRIQPELQRAVGRLAQRSTRGRYSDLLVGDDDFQLQVRAPERGSYVPSDWLSSGTADLLPLLLRLALVEVFAREGEPLPIFLDEVCVNLDPQRFDACLELLLETARRHQLFYLTCHEEHAKRLAPLAATTTALEAPPAAEPKSVRG